MYRGIEGRRCLSLLLRVRARLRMPCSKSHTALPWRRKLHPHCPSTHLVSVESNLGSSRRQTSRSGRSVETKLCNFIIIYKSGQDCLQSGVATVTSPGAPHPPPAQVLPQTIVTARRKPRASNSLSIMSIDCSSPQAVPGANMTRVGDKRHAMP